jgi:hypothetical protein
MQPTHLRADDPNCPINDIELAGCLPNLDVEPKDLTVEVTIEENIIGKGAYSVIKLGTLDNEKVSIDGISHPPH